MTLRLPTAAIALALAALVAGPARAHHVVWLDFTSFDLSAWPTVNGNTPPTQNDVDLVREQIITNMVRDYAPFDITFTEFAPDFGRFTQLAFLNVNLGGCLGCAGTCANCPCQNGTCTGFDSWEDGDSYAEVFAGSYAGFASGANATTAAIATGISHTASHELGHILDLSHCDANDGNQGSGNCDFTTDQNVSSHIMASGGNITGNQRITVDRFFSIHSSRRVLNENLQSRGHGARFRDFDADGDRDLVYAWPVDYDTVEWYERDNVGGNEFAGIARVVHANAGDAPDIMLVGDVTGDGDADLLNGESLGGSVVKWRLRRSDTTEFLDAETVSEDTGTPGSIFRLADVDGDQQLELIHGRPNGPDDADAVDWFVSFFNGSTFDASVTWAADIGQQDALWMLSDVNDDGLADLVMVERNSSSVDTKVFRSDGTQFLGAQNDSISLGYRPDHVMISDVDADGAADLVLGDVLGDETVEWEVALADPGTCDWVVLASCFHPNAFWLADGGNAGDLFRITFSDGDGMADLIFARAINQDDLTGVPDTSTLKWWSRLSTGSSFSTLETWADDAGGEGFIFP